MSRIGKLPVKVPKGVNITLNEQTVKVKGPHGELSQLIPQLLLTLLLEISRGLV